MPHQERLQNRELLGPFDDIESPWLEKQGIVPQADDGMVVAKGTIKGVPTVVVAIEGSFQGGSMGEVSGAKMSAALDLAALDCTEGRYIQAVLCLETGGVRLQEANLGLAAIADIHASIMNLRRYAPVIGIVAGTVGCFGVVFTNTGFLFDNLRTIQAQPGLSGYYEVTTKAGCNRHSSKAANSTSNNSDYRSISSEIHNRSMNVRWRSPGRVWLCG